LVAAIVSSLASMCNSVSTIFTMDVYSHYKKDASQTHYVKVGRIASLVALIIAMLCARPLLGQFDQAFQYIQEFTGFFTPGIVVLFLLGMFWKKMNANGAMVAALGSAIFSFVLKFTLPEIPFMDRVGIVFLLCFGLAIIVSKLSQKSSQDHSSEVMSLDDINFKTDTSYNILSLSVIIILIAFYSAWW
jgi:SSS family solute:Na+ symporter